MNILIVTSVNPCRNNAGVVALDIYNALNDTNANKVKILVKTWDRYKDKNIIPFENYVKSYIRRFSSKARSAAIKLRILPRDPKITDPDYQVLEFMQTKTLYNTQNLIKRVPFRPDAIIVLFMNKALSFKNLYEFNALTGAPIFSYMMDMAHMTGGCHYNWECKGYVHKCGNCPAMYSSTENDQSRRNWELKREYIKKTNLTVIAATECQYRKLLQSSLYGDVRKEKVLLGIDSETFKPGNKLEARKNFGIPGAKRVIFFGATNISLRRKGARELLCALNLLKMKLDYPSNIHLLIAGKNIGALLNKLPFPSSFLGVLDHSNLVKAFQASDVFVCPSIEDSGPMMINQSVMCGTPVVAFETGVALDLVINGKTGYHVKMKNEENFAEAIKTILCLDELGLKRISENCRETGLRLSSSTVHLREFMNILMKNDETIPNYKMHFRK